jgi:hypothetical protein
VDLAQPGTASASLRDIWPETGHGDLADVLLALRATPAGALPGAALVRTALAANALPVRLAAQPSWSGGAIAVLPWDELLGDAAGHPRSQRTLEGVLAAQADQFDIALIDYPADSGPLHALATSATQSIIMPLAPETPALEGAYATLRWLAHTRADGRAIALGGVLLTRCDPKNKRMFDVVQALLQADEVEGEPLSRRLFPFAIRANEFFEQAFRYGEPVWERTSNPTHWAGYVPLAEWLLVDAGLAHLAQPARRRGPALLPADTRILDVSSALAESAEVAYGDFERIHARPGA